MAPTPALPKGSLILVTGASSFIGANIVHEALSAGYKVRGTVRSEEKSEKSRTIFKNNPDYTVAIVPDAEVKGAFNEALLDVDAVIHVASNVTFSPDPNKVVQPTVDQVLDVLRNAAQVSSVKRFVYTSSSTAVLLPHPGKEVTVTAADWDQEALDLAFAPPPYNEDRAYAVYGASKVRAEQALWKFVKDEKPQFVVNSVLPDLNTGRILDSTGGTGAFIPGLIKGQQPFAPAQYNIDVVDCARLHLIAAAMDSSLDGERIFAFGGPFTWTQIVDIIKKHRPGIEALYQPEANELEDKSKVPNELGAELLRTWYGQDGYKPLHLSVLENLEGQI